MLIGEIIHQRRKELGLTLEDVGTYVGVGRSTVKKWEDGHILNMKRDKIALLAQILRLNPVTFIDGEIKDQKPEKQEDVTAMHSFGEQLRWIRLHKGLTQGDLAQMLGTSKQLISRYENGQSIPKISVVSEFAEKLHVSVDFLTNGTSLMANSKSPILKGEKRIDELIRMKYGEQAVLLLGKYAKLNDKGKGKLLENANDLTYIKQYIKEPEGRSMECRAIAYGGTYKRSTISEEQSIEASLLIKKIELDEI
ncbi:MAG: helix-turn-helix transcriptional regulator [Clostridiales bacterium]|nr:helix-turn-helix transcriptional regulator [Clostridiales bacterium]